MRDKYEVFMDEIMGILSFSTLEDLDNALRFNNLDLEYKVSEDYSTNEIIEDVVYIQEEDKYYYIMYIKEAFEARLNDLDEEKKFFRSLQCYLHNTLNEDDELYIQVKEFSDKVKKLYENNLNKYNLFQYE